MSRLDPERRRLAASTARTANWQRWGTYLGDRQWGTVREDYSAEGRCWEYFPFEQAHRRAYRWGEDGLLGLTDRECRLCLAPALWNGRDPILKERLFGLTNAQGNHGEDVKEYYYHLDATPTTSYARALYRYPQAAFPYADLVAGNARRGRAEREYELVDTGVFADGRFFDLIVEYAKHDPDDIAVRYTVVNHGPEPAVLHLLPTLWFRNTWSWGCRHEGCWLKPLLWREGDGHLVAEHATLGRLHLRCGPDPAGAPPVILVTENESNLAALFGTDGTTPWTKDAIGRVVVEGRTDACNPAGRGTKAAAHYRLTLAAGGTVAIDLRLAATDPGPVDHRATARLLARRRREADRFYAGVIPAGLDAEERRVSRLAYAGLLWSKRFYHYAVEDWLDGDPDQPPPPSARRTGRNAGWRHLFNRDIIPLPDAWEYPWYATWDLAFHLVPMARLDPDYARAQLVLFLREWYLHPNGQLPAYEFALDDVNPPVHAWACLAVHRLTGGADPTFLARCFQKLLINFTWWVNRKDPQGRNLFAGGFLGFDNIGVFDRSQPLPGGGTLEQADGTAWMGFFCGRMMAIALELAAGDPAYEDLASKFFEHFVAIVDALNTIGGTGLWDADDGCYYDRILANGQETPLRIRSLVGLLPMIAVEPLDHEVLARLPSFAKRLRWFLTHRPGLARHLARRPAGEGGEHLLLSLVPAERLPRLLAHLFDERGFLSPHGIRSLAADQAEHPYVFCQGDACRIVRYDPGESTTGLFGGNSNWRGPVWFPVNFLIAEALDRYHAFFGGELTVALPGRPAPVNLAVAAIELHRRLAALFLPDAAGRRPCHGDETRYADDPRWRDLVLFHEFFHGDTGRGCGASHQTGWTALVTENLRRLAGAPAGGVR